MMNTKNHPKHGLSLVEVLAALTFLSFVLVSLASLQRSLLKNAVRTLNRVEHSIEFKNLLAQAHSNGWDQDFEQHSITQEDTGVQVFYQRKPIPENSELKKYQHLFIENVEMRWNGLFGNQKDVFIALISSLPQESEKTV